MANSPKPSFILMIAFVFVIAIAVLYHLNRKVEERQLPIKQTLAMVVQWADLIEHNPGETGNLSEKDPWGVFLKKEVEDRSYRVVSAGPDKKFGSDDDIAEARAITAIIMETPDDLSNADVESIIDKALDTEEGREAIAESLVNENGDGED